ncbi:hypothetical protein EC2785200_4735 [Escherichia coli 2785200]|nr:hypothetical protein EC2785200_4735 [Escherichia coli 2785200]
MVSLSCGPMQDFRPGKQKLYEKGVTRHPWKNQALVIRY